MAFVFVSHASPDKGAIGKLVRRLLRERIPIWLDKPSHPDLGLTTDEIADIQRLHAGKSWPEGIEEAKRASDCILVCWSKCATTPGVLKGEERLVWLGEAGYGRTEGKLVCCTIDDVNPSELPDRFGLEQVFAIFAETCDAHDPTRKIPRDSDQLERETALLIDDVRAKLAEVGARRGALEGTTVLPQEVVGALNHLRQEVGKAEDERRVIAVWRLGQRAERYLRVQHGAAGNGLGERTRNVATALKKLDPGLYNALLDFIPVRNVVVHESDKEIPPEKIDRVVLRLTKALAPYDKDAPAPTPSIVVPRTGPKRIVVSTEGVGDVTSISSAVRIANDGDEIALLPGTYRETVLIDRAVSVVGLGRAQSETRVESAGDCIIIASPGVRLKDLNVSTMTTNAFAITVFHDCDRTVLSGCHVGALSGTGLVVAQGAGVEVDACNFDRATWGVRIEGQCHVKQCVMTNCTNGVLVRDEGQIFLQDAEFSDNEIDVMLEDCKYAEIVDSRFRAGGYAIVLHGKSRGRGKSNTFTGYDPHAIVCRLSDESQFELF